jgi:transposase-like protein
MHIQVSLKLEISATASLTDLEQGIQEAGQQAMREALKQAIRQREDQQVACPCCGHTQRRLEGTVGRVVATVFGRVSLPRRRFRCQNCWRRWCPANRLFVGLGGTTISEPLQEAARLAGSSWPYRVASQLLQKLSGAHISAEEIRLLTNKRGKQRAAEQQAEAERLTSSQQTSTEEKGKPPVLVGIDGGWVCSREQRGGMEGKVAVVCSQVQDLPMPTYSTTFSWSQRGGPRRPPRQRHRLAGRRYVATFASSQQLGMLAEAAYTNVVEDPSRPVVVIADGAHWIKKQQAQHFPQATCILDWAHLWREIRHAVSVAARAKGLSQRQRDYQMYLHRTWLWLGGVDQALQALRTLSTGLPAEPLETVKKAITYLENQRSWIGSYEQWRTQGYPVGSGMIERAVSLVINRRMKKRGMRWKRANATAIVALRTDLLNEDWTTPQRLRAFP